jgi:hypothetical protein
MPGRSEERRASERHAAVGVGWDALLVDGELGLSKYFWTEADPTPLAKFWRQDDVRTGYAFLMCGCLPARQ